MNNSFDWFWWELELEFFNDLEESLIWKLNDLEISTFAIQKNTAWPNNNILRININFHYLIFLYFLTIIHIRYFFQFKR